MIKLLRIDTSCFKEHTVKSGNSKWTSRNKAVAQSCPVKKGVLRNFEKLSGKCLCQSLFFNKFAGLRSATLLKKRLWEHRQVAASVEKMCQSAVSKNDFPSCFDVILYKSQKSTYHQVILLKNFPKLWLRSG